MFEYTDLVPSHKLSILTKTKNKNSLATYVDKILRNKIVQQKKKNQFYYFFSILYDVKCLYSFFFICMVTTYNECSLLGPNLFCLQHYNNIPFLMISLNFVTCHFFDLVNLIVDCPFKLMMCLLNENENRN